MSDETATTVVFAPLAVDTETAARMLGLSPSTVRAHVRKGDLIPRYSGTKPVFTIEDLREFLDSLPSK
jgi:hypothetical protein